MQAIVLPETQHLIFNQKYDHIKVVRSNFMYKPCMEISLVQTQSMGNYTDNLYCGFGGDKLQYTGV